jgi:redox-sensing transcriptional repressor
VKKITKDVAMKKVSTKTVERLLIYRRILLNLSAKDASHIFSHHLATLTGFTSAQIRRDLMAIGYFGSPARGYDREQLLSSISAFVDAPDKEGVAIVGLGHLGQAILTYFQGRRPKLEIVAVFDNDPQKINRVIHGCRCYHTNELEGKIQSERITVAIIAVPADEAQMIAERLVASGVRGVLNYAPVKLELPPEIYVDNRDMIMAVEKAAYFARESQRKG